MSTIGNTFRTGEPGLAELPNQVHTGDLQLPDFQRGCVWDDDHNPVPDRQHLALLPIGSV
ncbi:MAG TPA: hypothetical protein VGG06_31725 [Thermoanaerobaculia bacterium]|jgi:hypothetical protein